MSQAKVKFLAPTTPDEPISISLNISERDADLLRQVSRLLTSEAEQELGADPMQAGLRQFGALFLLRTATQYEITLAYPVGKTPGQSVKALPAKPSPDAARVKHVYGLNGICDVEHEPGHKCGAIRQRKPRGTASPAASVAQTGDLLSRTHGKNGQPEMPAVSEVEAERDPS